MNKDNFVFFPDPIISEIGKTLQLFDFEVNEKHKKITSITLEDYKKRNFATLSENIIRAGSVRGFLG